MSGDEMRDYEVTMVGEVREIYAVRARSEYEARQNWAEGDLVLSEAYGMGFESSREVQS